MRLTELDPFWISLGGNTRQTGFVFRCPHCRDAWLVCKCIPSDAKEQASVMAGRSINPPLWIPAGHDAIWHWEGDFPNLTVGPAVDYSKAGHWNGKITRGEITT